VKPKNSKSNTSKTLQPSEEQFQEQVVDLATRLGWRIAHFRSVRVQRKDGSIYYATPVQADGEGFPDLLMLNGTKLLVAELKADAGRLTPEQYEWLRAFSYITPYVYLWKPDDILEIQVVLQRG